LPSGWQPQTGKQYQYNALIILQGWPQEETREQLNVLINMEEPKM